VRLAFRHLDSLPSLLIQGARWWSGVIVTERNAGGWDRVVLQDDEEASMVTRVKNLIGRPVISAASGKRLGSVADVLLDSDSAALAGLIVRRGWLHDDCVLLTSDLQAFGADAVVSRSADLVSAKDWRQRLNQSHPAAETQNMRRPAAASRG
jgi:uncharacterized protein YrrD